MIAVIVSSAILALFATEKRIWDWLALVYTAFDATFETMCALFPLFAKNNPMGFRLQSAVHALLFRVVLWQFMRWMRMQTAIVTCPTDPATLPRN